MDGPPVLIVEVLSEATYESDTDLDRGKGYSYARAGVHEYLTLDPTGFDDFRTWAGLAIVARQVRALWKPQTDDRWHCESINVSIALDGNMAAVYTSSGRRLPREGEVEAAMAAHEMTIEADREIIARQATEIDNLRRRLEKS